MGKYTTSGLWEGEALIVDAHFGVKPEYNANATVLILDLETDDASMTEPRQELWSVGDNWVTEDGGETIIDPTKPGRDKIGPSQYGKFIDTAYELAGGDGGVVDQRLERDGVTTASVWKGLRFRFEQVEMPKRNIRGREVGGNDKLMPTAFLGEAGASAPSSNGALAMSDEEQTELKTLAMTANTHNEFVDAAMKSDAVKANAELIKEVAKPATFAALRG